MQTKSLKVTGGTARGMPLAQPRGVRLRPTSSLLREAIFNIIRDRIEDAKVLDLFAGTGALGIEALSLGAAHATFVEAEPRCCQAILSSIARAAFQSKATVLRGRLPAALGSLDGRFDIVLMDPPYGDAASGPTLEAVALLVAEGGLVVYEHASRYNPPERPPGLVLEERRVYGDSAIALYTLEEKE